MPGRVKRTYVTRSVSIPRTTSQFCTRQITDATLTASASAAVTGAYTFTLATLDQYSTFTSLFDQYRCAAIRISIVPQNNAIGLFTASTVYLESLYCVLDYDNSTALSNVAAARQYDNCIELAPAESLERTFKPRIAAAAYGSGAFTSYANMGDVWLDCASPNVVYYGVKVIIPQCAASQTNLQVWDVILEEFWEFRSVI